MKSNKLCPICDEGTLIVHYENKPAEYKGVTKPVSMAICVCDACGSETAGSSEMKYNKRAIIAFRKSVDGLLSGSEVKSIRRRYGLTQSVAGKLFGGGPLAFNKYENDDVAQSGAMDGLLRLVSENEDAYWDLVKIKGMTHELAPQFKVNVYTAHSENDAIFSAYYHAIDVAPSDNQRGIVARVLHHIKPAINTLNDNGWSKAVNHG